MKHLRRCSMSNGTLKKETKMLAFTFTNSVGVRELVQPYANLL